MRIQNNSNNKKSLDKALIIMAIITITMALLLIATIVLNNAEIKFFKQKGNEIKASYSATENNTWDISENGDGSVGATLSDDGILTISGTGKMKDWNEHDNTEWHGIKDKVKSVIIEDGVTNVGNFAFDRCINLISIEIKNSVTNIGDFAFAHCTNLASIKIMNGLTNIGEGAFIGCTSLISIEIPNSVISIGDNAFDSCTSLESVEIPNSVTSIGEYAFFECRSLTNVEISYSVTSIGYRAFDRCTSLTSINVDEDNKEYMDDNGVLYTKNGSEIIRYPAGKKEIIYTILTGTTSIGDMAFEGSTQLTSIEIPNSLMSIGWYAFERCTSLTTIEIPNSVTDIGYCAFFECTSLININIPNRVTVISAYIFYGCTSLNNIEISNGVTNIEGRAFMDCTSLKSINIPNSVTIIGDYAFYGCTSLTSINIPNNVTNIGVHALNKCSSLTSIDVDEDNENYMDDRGVLYTKDGSDLIKYPEGKKETIYTILMGTTSIRDYAFDGSINLTSIEIPNSVTIIEFMSFSYCTRLTTIAIPNSVTSIGVGVFDECPNLTIYCKKDSNAEQYAIDNDISYVIDDEAPTITSVIGNPTEWTKENVTLTINGAKDSAVGLAKEPYSFDGGATWQAENTKTYTENAAGIIIKVKDKLDNIYTHETIDITKMYKQGTIENDTLDISENADGSVVATLSEDGTLTISGTGKMKDWSTSDSTDWYAIKDKVNHVIIEEGVTNISNDAFMGWKNLISIKIPNSVTEIGWDAFYDCTSLTSIKIPDGITIIAGSTFRGCTSLTSVEIPNSVIAIGENAFWDCTSLTSIKIPNSVTSIAWYAFHGCTNLTNIEISNGVKDIGEGTFQRCTSLTSIKFPNSITNLGKFMFDVCPSLTNIEVDEGNKNYKDDNGVLYTKDGSEIIRFPEGKKETEYTILTGTTSVGECAFERCTSLTKIIVPDSVTTIDENVLYGATSLISIQVDEDNKNYMDDNGVLYTKDRNEIIKYPEGKKETEYTILTGTTSIGNYAFRECTSLTNIEIPNTVKNIGDLAFRECTGLKNIVIPNSVTNIGFDVFYRCTALKIYCTSDSYAKEYAINNRVKYVVDDEGPTMTNIEENPTSWTKGNVTLTINAEDSLAGLAERPYSFDGGATWQSENTKTYTENKSGIIIKVKDKLDNIYTHETINITQIDKIRPTITSVTGNPTQLTEEDVTLTISAYDDLSGLDAYSFDGGETWQTENTKTYTENTSGIIIAVKDQAGNVATYGETIKIDKINRLNVKLELYEEQKEENNTFITNIKQKTSIKEFVTNIKTNGTIEIYQGTEKITNTDTKIGTGMIVKITLNEIQREYITVIKGDTNGDGKADIQDIFAINKQRLNNGILTNAYLLAGDTNKDGKININDIFRINKYRLGIITEL